MTSTQIQFRDPKLVRVATGEGFDSLKWLMTVAANDYIEFYVSDNLTDWEMLADRFQVYDNAQRFVECPELQRVPLEDSTEQRWVLVFGRGAFTGTSRTAVQYYVGDVSPAGFRPTQNRRRLDQGPDFYAMQSWFAEPHGRVVVIGWMSNWQYAEFVPTSPWKGQLSVPRVLNLRKRDDEFVLVQRPHRDIETLRTGNAVAMQDFALAAGERFDLVDVARADVQITIEGADTGSFTLVLQHGGEATATLSWSSPTLMLARTGGETSFHSKFADTFSADIRLPRSSLDLRLLIDSSSLEIFANGGELVFSALIFPHNEWAALELTNTGGSALVVNATIYPMAQGD